jgi:hypothetical protein
MAAACSRSPTTRSGSSSLPGAAPLPSSGGGRSGRRGTNSSTTQQSDLPPRLARCCSCWVLRPRPYQANCDHFFSVGPSRGSGCLLLGKRVRRSHLKERWSGRISLDCPQELLPEGEEGEKTCAVALVGPGSSPSPPSRCEGSGTWRFDVHEKRRGRTRSPSR